VLHISRIKLTCVFQELEVSGLKENIFHGQALGMWPLKMDTPWFISDKPPKKSNTQNLLISRFY